VPVRAVGGVEAFGAGGLALVWDGTGYVVATTLTVEGVGGASVAPASTPRASGSGGGTGTAVGTVTSAFSPPTLTSSAESAAAAATTRTVSATYAAGDIITVIAQAEHGGELFTTISDTNGLTWTDRGTVTGAPAANFGHIRAWSAAPAGSGTTTITVTKGGSSTEAKIRADVWSDTDGLATAATTTNGGSAPSLSVTTTQDRSAVLLAVNDWNAVDGASRTYRTVNSITPVSGGSGELSYHRNAAAQTLYDAYWSDTGTAGAKTVGLTAPTGQLPAMLGIGVLGKAGAGGGSVSGVAAGAGGGAGTVSGVPRTLGTAAGNGGGAGTVAGVPRVVATAAGSGGGTGTASGTTATVVQGVAAGSGGGTGTVAGTPRVVATAAGSGGGAGAVVGAPRTLGTAAGNGGGSGTALGTARTLGTGAGSGGGSGAVAGTPRVVASAAGAGGGTGTVLGSTSGVTVGTAAGSGGGSGAALGISRVVGIAAGLGGGTGTATTGAVPYTGAQTGGRLDAQPLAGMLADLPVPGRLAPQHPAGALVEV
jgi:hypothetical protein